MKLFLNIFVYYSKQLLKMEENLKTSRWEWERSSGHNGYRCRLCATWVYADEEKKCKCNLSISEEKKKLSDWIVIEGYCATRVYEIGRAHV